MSHQVYKISCIRDGLGNVVLGTDEKIGILESQNNGESFASALREHDGEIASSLFIRNLLYDQGSTGSYSQSETHLTMLYNNLNSILNMLDLFMNKWDCKKGGVFFDF